MTVSGYDIIGDVHGCARTLEKLLRKMGYQPDARGVYCHPARQAIFIGDVVDRGPRIREALHLVKNMVDAGSAQCIMGNHEFNALAYTTPIAEIPEQDAAHSDPRYLRAHSARNNRLIAETLMQFAPFPEEWRMFLSWFRQLPIFLEFSDFRVVHACWDDNLIAEFRRRGYDNRIDERFLQATADKTSFEGRFIDRLTRGTDIQLPGGRHIVGKDGYQRSFFRTKFWAHAPLTYQDVVFQPDPLPDDLAARALSSDDKQALLYYKPHEKPVFIGHYWLHGRPKPLRANVACVDYSAVKYGRLVAYRYDGEASLNESKFTWVYVDAESVNS